MYKMKNFYRQMGAGMRKLYQQKNRLAIAKVMSLQTQGEYQAYYLISVDQVILD